LRNVKIIIINNIINKFEGVGEITLYPSKSIFFCKHKKLNNFLNDIPRSGFFGRLCRRGYCKFVAVFLLQFRRKGFGRGGRVIQHYSTKKYANNGKKCGGYNVTPSFN